MIRLLLLTLIPLILPFAAWYAWDVFGEKPVIDPVTGEQEPPKLKSAPLKMLFFIGTVLSMLTLGAFLLFHDQIANDPYSAINVEDAGKRLERGIAPDRPNAPR
ncbi:MAG: hypothetical protein CFH41_00132 [Alphaproteobacteria bacterium MarineAlpha11_Bin1]|nr:MAG: hypothetical protein CFH41_00132 [Alphaproteobacteria bacterium MarineAlpha11_Bin1]|tara:strand:- start:2115 stop:2426 length:312 start_codon:yes stop_codon:yes gene_type:complete